MLQCDSRMKGHVQGRGKNSSWATEAKALTKPRTCVFPDLNNQEGCRAFEQVHPGQRWENSTVFLSHPSTLFICCLPPPTYSKSNSRADTVFCSLNELLGETYPDGCTGKLIKPKFIYFNTSRHWDHVYCAETIANVPLPPHTPMKAWRHLLFRFQTSFLQCLSNYSH